MLELIEQDSREFATAPKPPATTFIDCAAREADPSGATARIAAYWAHGHSAALALVTLAVAHRRNSSAFGHVAQ